jgi:dihydroorotate dehydrogenase electron transfer subunit
MSMETVVHKCLTARVLENVRTGSDGFILRAAVPAGHELGDARILPGHFCMLRDPRPGFPFLSRPFSVLDYATGADGRVHELSFLFKVVGRGTEMLASLAPGAPLEVVGPLGNTWPEAGPRRVVAVAGGIGIPPLSLALQHARRQGQSLSRHTLLYGARSAGQLYLRREIESLGVPVQVATEDGSAGRRGRVDVLLRELLDAESAKALQIHACGPERMLEVVGHLAAEAGVRCYLSLETFMGCGFGVCNACAVKVRDASRTEGFKYERCCREGSIFDQSRLMWD